jgi:hypothetical protein
MGSLHFYTLFSPFFYSKNPAMYPVTRLQSLDSKGNAPAPPPGPSTHSQSMGSEEDRSTHGESCCSSASSSSSLDSTFSHFEMNAEFFTKLQAAEDAHFAQRPFQACSQPPLPMSSPPAESSSTQSTTATSLPSSTSSLTLSDPDEPPSTTRRWVVFRERILGIYSSS